MNINYLAVLVSAVVIFMLGGLWYSPVLFATKWVALQGRSTDEMSGKANLGMYVQVFICGFLTSLVMAPIISHLPHIGLVHGIGFGAAMWLGFAGATSYGTGLFSLKPKALWAIDSGFNLVSFIIAAVILSTWR